MSYFVHRVGKPLFIVAIERLYDTNPGLNWVIVYMHEQPAAVTRAMKENTSIPKRARLYRIELDSDDLTRLSPMDCIWQGYTCDFPGMTIGGEVKCPKKSA